jgi:hypothetical protein
MLPPDKAKQSRVSFRIAFKVNVLYTMFESDTLTVHYIRIQLYKGFLSTTQAREHE